MVTRTGTKQRKTRHKLRKHYRQKGKIPLSKYFQVFTASELVHLKINPSVQKGRFFPRFYGLTGTITGRKKGTCYEVMIKDGGKEKSLYVHPVHLQRA